MCNGRRDARALARVCLRVRVRVRAFRVCMYVCFGKHLEIVELLYVQPADLRPATALRGLACSRCGRRTAPLARVCVCARMRQQAPPGGGRAGVGWKISVTKLRAGGGGGGGGGAPPLAGDRSILEELGGQHHGDEEESLEGGRCEAESGLALL